MKRRAAATEIGLGWYRREDWNRLLQMFPDRAKLHDTYDEWLKDVHHDEKLVKHKGNVVKRIVVGPDELAPWCVSALVCVTGSGAGRLEARKVYLRKDGAGRQANGSSLNKPFSTTFSVQFLFNCRGLACCFGQIARRPQKGGRCPLYACDQVF
jgi:hypothetical protein